MKEIDLTQLEQWIERSVAAQALITADTARLMAATLDRETDFRTGDPLPPAWHWLYFREPVQASDLGGDGHARLGGFLPPVPLPRRMWAGGRLAFERPLRIGDQAVRRSTVKSITPKTGSTGQLCFVVVEHEVSVGDARCLLEEQTIVYREAAGSGPRPAAPPAPSDAEFSAAITPDPILLFRYSALTFNSHRIHYDVTYCREMEGYPDLVVHGPLIATLLLDLFYRQFPDDRITGFDYRARSPLFNPQPFTVNGARAGEMGRAWAANHEGGLAMEASVALSGGADGG